MNKSKNLSADILLLFIASLLCLSVCACEQKQSNTIEVVDATVETAPELMSDASISISDMQSDLDSSFDEESQNYPDTLPGLSEQTIEQGELTREYLLYIPASYNSDIPTPIIFNFHSNGDTARVHLQISDMRELADQENVILVYPQGSQLDGEGSHWNPLLSSENNKSNADDFGFIEMILDRLSQRINVDSNRVYATGYSNGAGFAYGLLCYLSDRITAAAPVSGSMYIEMSENCNANHPTAIAIFNGTEDYIRPYGGYPGYLLSVEDAYSFWRNYNQIDGPPSIDLFNSNNLTVERTTYSGGSANVSVVLYKVIGGDHVWFDIDIEGQDLDYLIWNFLSRYDRNGLR